MTVFNGNATSMRNADASKISHIFLHRFPVHSCYTSDAVHKESEISTSEVLFAINMHFTVHRQLHAYLHLLSDIKPSHLVRFRIKYEKKINFFEIW
jgi:hypothetical protein